MRMIKKLLFTALMLVPSTALAANGTILYIPMDNRPVCLDYTVQTMQAAGWDVQTPPLEYIANDKRAGDPEQLFKWLEEKADESVAVVASSDALLYGGLVASRTHEIPFDVLQERAERLVALKNNHGGQNVYIFATIMRSPKASSAPVEPAYYKEWGPSIFRLGALEDKLELKELRRREVGELADLRAAIPREILEDLYSRRRHNIKATELLLHGVESGDFDYMLIGRDDTAPYSQAHREARSMDILVSELPKERIRFFAGADQLGMLLLSRASTRLQYELPLVNVTYAPGAGKNTIPSYEDETVANSAVQHIFAAGGFPARTRQRTDLVLAVNTPKDGVCLEASSADNTFTDKPEITAFVNKVKRLLKRDHKIALADIKYGNGADNSLVKALFDNNIAYDLEAYGGWNTGGNSLGFALAQGLLHKMLKENDKNQLLEERYLEDWAYQANVRQQVYQKLIWPNYWPNSGLDAEQKAEAEKQITAGIQELTEPVMGNAAHEYQFTLPWSRMFEVKVEKKAD